MGRPRAIAAASTVKYVASVTVATVGRRRLRAPVPTTWASTPPGSVRRTTVTVRTVFRCVASRNREAARPRAIATPAPVHCMPSAAPGTVGRRRCPVPMSASWTSAPPGSGRRIATTVRTVFSCVASRNRCRWALQPDHPAEKTLAERTPAKRPVGALRGLREQGGTEKTKRHEGYHNPRALRRTRLGRAATRHE